MKECILSRTKKALGIDLIKKLRKIKFCIVGCGAVGSIFSEILIRTGAIYLVLIDGDTVNASNLNRGSFTQVDIGKYKVCVVANRLKLINPEVKIENVPHHLKERLPDMPSEAKRARDTVCNSEIVVNVPDTNRARITCSKLCDESGGAGKRIKTLSIGVAIGKDHSKYACFWNPKPLREENIGNDGYGNYGSYTAIVTEATSVGFMMLLHNLKNPKSDKFIEYRKTYKNYAPQSFSQ